MTHEIVFRGRFVEVIHTGDVGYPERLSALDHAKTVKEIRPGMPVLINFLGAVLRPSTAEGERVDYSARAAVDSFFAHRRVAMLGGDEQGVRPAAIAAQIRNLPFRTFSEREYALRWLLAED